MKVIIVSSIKGGVGKTTTSNILIDGLRRKKYKVLGIDLDQQCNLSFSMEYKNGFSSYDMLKGIDIKEVIQNDFIPASPSLSDLDAELGNKFGKEFILRKQLKAIQDMYDYVVIDTAPSTSLATINAYISANYVLIPAQSDAYNINSLNDCFELIEGTNEYYQGAITGAGILLTRFAEKGVLNQVVKETIEDKIKGKKAKLFNTFIRENKQISEATFMKQSLFDYKPNSNGAIDYMNFIDELLCELDPTYKVVPLMNLLNDFDKKDCEKTYAKLEAYSLKKLLKEICLIFDNPSAIEAEDLLRISADEAKLKVLLFFYAEDRRRLPTFSKLADVIRKKLKEEEQAKDFFLRIYKKEN